MNPSNPGTVGRTLTYYGYFAAQRSQKIKSIQGDETRLQQLVAQVEQQSQDLQKLEESGKKEIADLQHARAERTVAVAALTKKLESGNQELGNLKREEQAVESLVADLARMMQDFPTDPSQSFDHMPGKLPWPALRRVAARYQAPRQNCAGRLRSQG